MTGGPAPLTYRTWLKTCGVILVAAGVVTAGWAYAVHLLSDWYIRAELSHESIKGLAEPVRKPLSEFSVGQAPMVRNE